MLHDVLKRISDKPQAVPLPQEVRRYLEHHQIPADIVEDLALSSFDDWIQVGPLQIIPMPRLIRETDSITVCIEEGLHASLSLWTDDETDWQHAETIHDMLPDQHGSPGGFVEVKLVRLEDHRYGQQRC